ncbi:hypothetical protein JL722_10634 [Aureococcus anophagefferens]|nr:hypothetical protein JL722_10634 [Aureococcus anophagefferens]
MAADAAGDLGAVAAWARTFAGCEAAEASKLGNGVALSLVFAEVSGEAAGLDVTGDLGESNWALGAGRLRRLLRRAAEWYAVEVGRDVSALADDVDAEGAAKGDAASSCRAAELVLGAAVQCARKQRYIGAIMSLDDASQAALMVVVERAMQAVSASPAASGDARAASPARAPRAATATTRARRDRREVAALRTRDAAEAAGAKRCAAAEAARDELAAELEEARGERAAAVAQAERAKRLSGRTRGERLATANGALEGRVDALLEAARTAATAKQALVDELDVARSRCAEAEVAEARADKLRKKVEDLSSARREMKDLDDQNAAYLAEILRLEGVSALELKDAELRRCREDLEEASEARRFFEEARRDGAAPAGGDAAAAPDGGDDFAPVFGESAAQLRAKVARLERENQRLEAAAAAPAAGRRRAAARPRGRARGPAQGLEASLAARARRLDARAKAADAEATRAASRARRETRRGPRRREALAAAPAVSAAPPETSAAPPPPAADDRAAVLAERDATIAKLQADREKLETYTRKTLHNVQEKYSVLVQTYKNQIKEKQDKITNLEARVRTDRTAHKREEGLVVSAIYDLGQRVIEANLAALHNPADGADPRDFKPPGATTPRGV